MRRRIQTWALAAAVLAGGVAACGGAARSAEIGRDVGPLDDGVPLRVRNNTRTDMQIFVVDGGGWTSVGFVTAGSAADLDVPGLNETGAPLRILATPVVGQGAAHAGPLTVRRGQTVTFTIEPDLDHSSAIVR